MGNTNKAPEPQREFDRFEKNKADSAKRAVDYRYEEEKFVLVAKTFLIDVEGGLTWRECAAKLEPVFGRPIPLTNTRLEKNWQKLHNKDWWRRKDVLEIDAWERDNEEVQLILDWIESGQCLWETRNTSHGESKLSRSFQTRYNAIYPIEEEVKVIKTSGRDFQEDIRHGFGRGQFACEHCRYGDFMKWDGKEEKWFMPGTVVIYEDEQRKCVKCGEISTTRLFCRAGLIVAGHTRFWEGKFGVGKEDTMVWKGVEITQDNITLPLVVRLKGHGKKKTATMPPTTSTNVTTSNVVEDETPVVASPENNQTSTVAVPPRRARHHGEYQLPHSIGRCKFFCFNSSCGGDNMPLWTDLIFKTKEAVQYRGCGSISEEAEWISRLHWVLPEEMWTRYGTQSTTRGLRCIIIERGGVSSY
ncbi:hypothetical protein EJ08DRAFT_676172 [Tothia fuscella]|uniref:Uncharacterized protein n=1 Tax=Tothia fuscella TaxID=1048955 RepID=A0A9P4U2P6_9PEZI|nr:hypothetical protein EJ08DRAFT_676172 [Tothia fuscella]